MTTPWLLLTLLAIIIAASTIFVAYIALRVEGRPALTGTEGLIGATGITKSAFRAGETGSVFVHGEWWNARITSGEIAANKPVRVLARQSMTLIVVPIVEAFDEISVATSAVEP